MKIEALMTTNPVSTAQNIPVKKVAELMRDCDIGAMLITQTPASRHLTGIITDRDLCTRVLAQGLSPDTPVSRVMTTRLATCEPGESVAECETLMQLHEVRRIPVIDHEHNILGIVSASDILRYHTTEKAQRTVKTITKPRRKAPPASSRKAS